MCAFEELLAGHLAITVVQHVEQRPAILAMVRSPSAHRPGAPKRADEQRWDLRLEVGDNHR